MPLGSLALILVSVTLSAVAQVAFKIGVAAPTAGSHSDGPLAMLLAPGVLIGLSIYAAGTLLWLTALQRVELSQAYPFVGIGFALTTLAGWWLFDDQLSAQRLTGIALVIVGITLVARS